MIGVSYGFLLIFMHEHPCKITHTHKQAHSLWYVIRRQNFHKAQDCILALKNKGKLRFKCPFLGEKKLFLVTMVTSNRLAFSVITVIGKAKNLFLNYKAWKELCISSGSLT